MWVQLVMGPSYYLMYLGSPHSERGEAQGRRASPRTRTVIESTAVDLLRARGVE